MIYHFNNSKSLNEIGKLIKKKPVQLLQHVIDRFKNEKRVVKKRCKKDIDRKGMSHGFLDILNKNSTLSAPDLASKVEKYLHNKVNSKTIRRVLRKNKLVHRRVVRKNPP